MPSDLSGQTLPSLLLTFQTVFSTHFYPVTFVPVILVKSLSSKITECLSDLSKQCLPVHSTYHNHQFPRIKLPIYLCQYFPPKNLRKQIWKNISFLCTTQQYLSVSANDREIFNWHIGFYAFYFEKSEVGWRTSSRGWRHALLAGGPDSVSGTTWSWALSCKEP